MEKVKILIIDDRPENLFTLEQIIKENDREIFSVNNGNEALKLTLKHEFALILSDVQMPEMDGFEMLEILRLDEKNKLIPVIFVTAISKEERYIHKGYSEGAIDYLFKPLDPTIVRAKVDVFISLYQKTKELKNNNLKLQKLQEEKNLFLGMIAHDLRNPLLSIQSYSDFLFEDLADVLDPNSEKFLGIIKSSSTLMFNLVKELLELSKIDSSSFALESEYLNLNEVIEQAILMNKLVAGRKNITITSVLSNNIPNTMIDGGKMMQVMNNLISNAIKYSNKDTEVTISSSEENGKIKISVKDRGLGIDPKEIETLFDAYTTTSNQATAGETSTGLGLMITSKIIQAHKGEITVKSEKGVGSEFIVTIPLSKEKKTKTIEPAQKTIPITNNTGEKYKLLYVDDCDMTRLVVSRMFMDYNLDVDSCNGGKEALERLQNNHHYDIIFTDINMPEMNGFEFCEKVKSKGHLTDSPVIGLSATIIDSVVEQGKKSGMIDVFEKPLSQNHLNFVLNKYVKKMAS